MRSKKDINIIYNAVAQSRLKVDEAVQLLGIRTEDFLTDLGVMIGGESTIYRLLSDGLIDIPTAAAELGISTEGAIKNLELFERQPLSIWPFAQSLQQLWSPLTPVETIISNDDDIRAIEDFELLLSSENICTIT